MVKKLNNSDWIFPASIFTIKCGDNSDSLEQCQADRNYEEIADYCKAHLKLVVRRLAACLLTAEPHDSILQIPEETQHSCHQCNISSFVH